MVVIQVYKFLLFEQRGLFLNQLMSKNEVKLTELVLKLATFKYQKFLINQIDNNVSDCTKVTSYLRVPASISVLHIHI